MASSQYVISGFGALIIAVGIILIAFGKFQGSAKLDLKFFNLDIRSPGLFVFVCGAAIFVLPFTKFVRLGQMFSGSQNIVCENPGELLSEPVPDPNVLNGPYKPFVGTWAGTWINSKVCGVLLVQQTNPDDPARVTYIYGLRKDNNVHFLDLKSANVNSGVLILDAADKSQYKFSPEAAGLKVAFKPPPGHGSEQTSRFTKAN